MTQEKKLLLSAAGPNMVPILEKYSQPLFERFAAAQGYDVQVAALEEDDVTRKGGKAKSARWAKINLMQQALRSHDLVAWFDADVLIRRTDEDIADHLGSEDFQGLVLHSVPTERRINPNTGVWVMRNSEIALDFLDEVQEIGMPDGRWADQGAVLKALGWIMGDENYYGARPGPGTRFTAGTAYLPTGWNQPHKAPRSNAANYVGRPEVADPQAIHFMGMAIAEREFLMDAVLDEITTRQTQDEWPFGEATA